MIQTATTIEQSKRLLDAGIPSYTADMCYIFIADDGNQCSQEEAEQYKEEGGDYDVSLRQTIDGYFDHSYESDCPAWSLMALLDYMPIRYKLVDVKGYMLTLYLPLSKGEGGQEVVTFMGENDLFGLLVKALIWCKDRDYKFKD